MTRTIESMLEDTANGALTPALQDVFERWIETTVDRFVPPLTPSEVRRGVHALSSLYVERRGEGNLAARALDGAAKRAALATYYAPLHFLAAWPAALALAHACIATAAAGETPPAAIGAAGAPRRWRVHDLGCGTGAVGAAVALAFASVHGTPPAVHALDRSGWAIDEARATYRSFGLAHRERRGVLPGALPRAGRGDLLVFGFVVNELDVPARTALIDAIGDRLEHGASLLLLEPLARTVAPWWSDATAVLASRGARAIETKREIERPAWIERLDDASGLDHREVGARALVRAAT